MNNHNLPILLRTLLNEETKDLPVWLMRQAGRYLPEYRALKESYSFNELSENPELAAEVTIQPLKRFPQLDAAIFFADILTPAKSLGFKFEFVPGPKLQNPILTPEDIHKIELLDVKKINSFVFEGVSKVRDFLNKEDREHRRAMLGFAATPWTLACYLIDQGIYKNHLGTKIFAEKYPEEFSKLCTIISDITVEYLCEKVKAGADAVQLFDTWASLLNPSEHWDLSGKYIERITSKLKSNNIPFIIYTQGDLEIIKLVAKAKPNAISIDWRTSLVDARRILPPEIVLQGNFDPCKLFSTPTKIKSEAEQMYSKIKNSNIIANLGHGILPQTPIESVSALLNAVKAL